MPWCFKIFANLPRTKTCLFNPAIVKRTQLVIWLNSQYFQAIDSTLFGYNYGYTWISEVGCLGNEASLLNCTHNNASCEQRTTNYAVAACSQAPIDESRAEYYLNYLMPLGRGALGPICFIFLQFSAKASPNNRLSLQN